MAARVVLGFFVLVAGFLLTYLVVEFLALFIAIALHYRFERPIYIVAAAASGFLGVVAGKWALDRFLKTYPSREIAMVFMGLNALIIAKNLLMPPPDGMFSNMVVLGVIAILAAFLYLWQGKTAASPA